MAERQLVYNDEFPKYHKIHSLFKRDMKTHRLINGDYSRPEFENIMVWDVYEKIDGTNIRIGYFPEQQKVKIGGRTENADIPAHLLGILLEKFPLTKFQEIFKDTPVILWGEGYGPKIQKAGASYSDSPGFALFDVSINRKFLSRDNLAGIASQFDVHAVPFVGKMQCIDVIEYIANKPESIFSKHSQTTEGVVCTPVYEMYDRRGERIIFKLKCIDY